MVCTHLLRAPQFARNLSSESDRQLVSAFATELEAEAMRLESTQAASGGPKC
jgi:hypothetical protein